MDNTPKNLVHRRKIGEWVKNIWSLSTLELEVDDV